MKNLTICLIAFLLTINNAVNGQGIGINPAGLSPDSSAMLDVKASNKGVLIPRLTTMQRDAIANPAQALQIYNLTTKCFEFWENGFWQTLVCATCPIPAQPSAISGNASPCEGSSQTYSVTNVAGVTYTWTFPSGWTQTGGGTTNSVIVTVGSASGNIQITATTICGTSPAQTLAVAPVAIPASPTAATHSTTQTQITWNWNTVSGATGYKYNTVNDYSNATDNGSNTSYNQSGLTCNTSQTLYVWAYNACGNSNATTLTQTTSSCCTDGTGGTITHVGGNTIHTFTSNETFTPNCAMNVQVLVVAGGGGGGAGGGGGGGAGGFIYNASYAVTVQSYFVTVGSGGQGGTGYNNGNDGSNSLFATFTAIGGGGGGGSSFANGRNGGSGGGGAQGPSNPGGAGTPGQGNAGGTGTNYASPFSAAGGGGAGASGQNTVNASTAGSGGVGLSSTISGSTVYYAGGGGGAVWGDGGTAGAGGNGGGGAGCSGSFCVGSNATANTGGGGGGGGGSGSGVGGSGGSGIVIISYPTP